MKMADALSAKLGTYEKKKKLEQSVIKPNTYLK